MFSETRTNGMYSNSAAQARGTRVQSPKREEILRWNTYSSFANFENSEKNIKIGQHGEKHFGKQCSVFGPSVLFCSASAKSFHFGASLQFVYSKSITLKT